MNSLIIIVASSWFISPAHEMVELMKPITVGKVLWIIFYRENNTIKIQYTVNKSELLNKIMVQEQKVVIKLIVSLEVSYYYFPSLPLRKLKLM